MVIIIGIVLFISILACTEWHKSVDKKKYLIKNSLYLVLSLAFLFLFGPLFGFSPLKIGYQTQKIENKIIIYPCGWEAKKDQFIQLANQAEKNILDFYPQQFPVTIILAKNNFDLFRFTGMRGGGNNSLGRVYISSSYIDEGLITAELSHYYLFNTANRSSLYFPRWFDEGLAIYLGHSGSTAKFTQAETLERLLNDDRYSKDLNYWNGFGGQLRWMWQIYRGGYVSYMYTHSYYLVKFLIEEYGLDNFYILIDELKTNSSFENAFQGIYGFSTNQLANYFASSAQQYLLQMRNL